MERSPGPGSIELTGRKLLTDGLATHSLAAGAEGWLQPEYMTVRDYWQAVRNHIWLVSGIVALFTVAVGYLMVSTPDYYNSIARVEINVTSTNPAVGDGHNYLVPVDVDPTYFNTQLQIIGSPTLLRRVINGLKLESDRIFNRHMSRGGHRLRMLFSLFYWGKTDSQLGLMVEKTPLDSQLSPSETPEQIAEGQRLLAYVEDLQKRITVEPVKEARSTLIKDTRLVDITFRYPNPQLGAQIVNAIADSFAQQNRDKQESNNSGAGRYLNQRVRQLKEQIRADQESLLEYSKNHEILSLDPGQNTTLDRLVSLNRQLVDAENQRKLAEANYLAATEPGAAIALAYESSKQIADAEAKLPDLRQKRAQLLVTATEKYPDVQEVNQEISALETEIDAIRKRAIITVLTNLETRYRQALGHEQAIREAFQQQQQSTVTQNEAAVNYRLIEQEIETNKGLLNSLLQRLGENDLAAAGTADNIRVVDRAIVPENIYPDGPFRLLWISLAFLMSSSFAIGVALFLEHLDNTLRSGKDVRSVLQVPCFALIPSIARPWLPRLLTRTGGVRLNGGSGRRPSLLLDHGAPPHLFEAYRRLRTAVLLSSGGPPPRKILVTSSTPGEGKSTIVANLATSLANTGAKVLVVDADLRRPRQQALFLLKNSAGLRTSLTEKIMNNDDDAFLKLVQRHDRSGVYVLTSGPQPPNPSELLGSERMGHLLERFRRKFDYILVDSPALAVCTDAVLLSLVADGVLLVVHGGVSPREVVRYSYEQLLSVGARVLGVVLNNVALNSTEPRDYYYKRAALLNTSSTQ
jgi:succinoglycan biosynthesis transport protein ExoP